MNIAMHLKAAARAFPTRAAVSLGTRTHVTYSDLGKRAAQLAGALRAAGFKKGERVGVAMSNCPEYIEVLFGIWHAGLCAVPLNAKLHARETAYALGHSASRWCFITEGQVAQLETVPDEVDMLERMIVAGSAEYLSLLDASPAPLAQVSDSDPAWLFYTSGTTGRPKGATLTHRSLNEMMLRYFADMDFISDADCMLHPAPLSHGGGLFALAHVAKASHHVIPASGGFDPDEIFALTHSYDNMTFFVVPTMLNRLVGCESIHGARLEAIKTIIYGGAPMYLEDLKRALAVLGPKLIQTYAQGETPNTLTHLSKRVHADVDNPRYEERLSSVGIARTGVEFRIVNESGEELPPGTPGEVITRSDVCMSGYWNNPQATAEALRDGWLWTGDVGVVDEDGYLTLKDRSKDLIISGGSNIYPREVEEVILMHPAVLEVSVVGRPHADWGEVVVAFYVCRPGQTVTGGDLDRLCLGNMARFKRPKEYIQLDALPKSDYGKILKSDLRKRFPKVGS